MKKILVTFKVVQGEQEFYEYVSLKDNDWTDDSGKVIVEPLKNIGE